MSTNKQQQQQQPPNSLLLAAAQRSTVRPCSTLRSSNSSPSAPNAGDDNDTDNNNDETRSTTTTSTKNEMIPPKSTKSASEVLVSHPEEEQLQQQEQEIIETEQQQQKQADEQDKDKDSIVQLLQAVQEIECFDAAGRSAAAHRSFHKVLLCVHKNSISFLVHCSPVYSPFDVVFDRRPLAAKSSHWEYHLKPTDSDRCFNAVRIFRGTVQKPTRDSLDDDAAYVGCSFGLL
jgi:hypothetical protein